MITNQTKKLVVSVLFALATITTTQARYTQAISDALFHAYYPQLAKGQTLSQEVQPVATEPTKINPVVQGEPEATPVDERKPESVSVKTDEPEMSPVVTREPETALVQVPEATIFPVETPEYRILPAELLEENEEEKEEQSEISLKERAQNKLKAVIASTTNALKKPGTQVTALAVTLGAYMAKKAFTSALSQHQDKHGLEKLTAVFNTMKKAGLGNILAGTQRSLSQDPSLKQAFVGFAVDSIIGAATNALVRLSLPKSA